MVCSPDCNIWAKQTEKSKRRDDFSKKAGDKEGEPGRAPSVGRQQEDIEAEVIGTGEELEEAEGGLDDVGENLVVNGTVLQQSSQTNESRKRLQGWT